MKVTVEKLPNCQAKVNIEIPGETRKEARERILRDYIRHAALPGFRKGKVPRSVVEKRFAAEIDREVADRLANDGLNAAVEQEKLKVLSVGGFKPADDNSDARFAFTLEVMLAPEVTLPDYKGLSITVPKAEVTEADIEKVLDNQRERLADIVVANRPVKLGDFLTIDYTATADGAPVKDMVPEAQNFIGESSGYMLKATEDSFLPGFCAQLEGMQAGESREVKLTLPGEGLPESIAGKEVVYHVTVQEVKEPILPELNDELAERIIPGKTLDEIRAIIRQNLEAALNQKDLERKRIAAMIALREKVDFDLPGNVVHNATQRRVNQLVQMNRERGIEDEVIRENEEDIIKAANDQAQVDVKDEFILMEIVDRENLAVTEQDMVRRVTHIAQTNNTSPDRVVKALKKNDGLSNLRHSILLGKALDVLVEHALVSYDGTVGPEELSQG
jgi:trigger factor